MAFKVGDKAKVVDKESLLYNKTVELVEVGDEAYIFNSENPKLKLVVHESAMQRTIKWESSPDRGEKNLSMKFDKIDEEYFAGLALGVIISILIGAAFLGVILLANWLYTFCE